jgi:hypothetical protein
VKAPRLFRVYQRLTVGPAPGHQNQHP